MGMVARGVDLSHHNGNVDFRSLSCEVDFVILKIGGSERKGHKCFKDVAFDEYYRRAKEAGLNVGAYFFVGSDFSEANAIDDAKYLWRLLQGKKFEYPIFIDIEAQPKGQRINLSMAVCEFLDYLEDHNYFVGIYASDISGFKERLYKDYLKPYTWWVARYGKQPQYATENLGIWQTSSDGIVTGCPTKVDTDISFIKYDDIIKKKHLNGY